jgi:hypothetical protein
VNHPDVLLHIGDVLVTGYRLRTGFPPGWGIDKKQEEYLASRRRNAHEFETADAAQLTLVRNKSLPMCSVRT